MNSDKLVDCIGLVIVFIIGVVGLVLWNGYVLSTAWQLLLVPLFELPSITIAQAIGLSAIVSFLTVNVSPNSDKAASSTKDFIDILFTMLGSFALAFSRGLMVLLVIYSIT